ncbi:CaiF/GrlA family transcriptional regulator [Salmonella enterica]
MEIKKKTPGCGEESTQTEIRSDVRRKRSQSNHDEYLIPESMVAWSHEPLYLIIARWCIQEARWINRNDIVQAFNMPERRASFLMSYISRKKDRVACRIRSRPHSDTDIRRQRNEIRVDRILPVAVRREIRQRAKVRTGGAVSRRVGSGMKGNAGLWERLLKTVREEPDEG